MKNSIRHSEAKEEWVSDFDQMSIFLRSISSALVTFNFRSFNSFLKYDNKRDEIDFETKTLNLGFFFRSQNPAKIYFKKLSLCHNFADFQSVYNFLLHNSMDLRWWEKPHFAGKVPSWDGYYSLNLKFTQFHFVVSETSSSLHRHDQRKASARWIMIASLALQTFTLRFPLLSYQRRVNCNFNVSLQPTN